MLTLTALLFCALGYLLGSIPFGLVVSKLGGAPDPRTIGSHNIGATNVLRSGRKGLAAATLLLDALKGTAAVLIASFWGETAMLAAALGAFLGHLFPVWLSFKGGTGVATFLGCLIGLYWPAAVLFAVVWLAVAAASRYSSLAALVASAITPVALNYVGRVGEGGLYLALTLLLFFKHRENISRLLSGMESKIGGKK